MAQKKQLQINAANAIAEAGLAWLAQDALDGASADYLKSALDAAYVGPGDADYVAACDAIKALG